ncbi:MULTISPECIES: glycosyltransferase family 2 protein [unclassified Breznakia]|uniref:glycosyltransferase family 2 protein n=1 Tax=unclassified Breznakia TaxID=2623764 RepID=UPI0024735574|nr:MULTISPECIES: glycosyltransferase family 2 protein [unclassified Breznakia]MDH6367894.1 hypothetical protein [Breznakia sp. PH1-1]MDH6404982.1 hypothetical protein [Breznakia sp. PF1-11]MDH6412707.1 hypothetical protein [Breznakia sp. PFB1-11]MDH6415057.1 hypothetical protein [Breznakia sp. PFB1-14]MDH6417368.1 hypothetical protein [Breznakia sp. PFB1-4]
MKESIHTFVVLAYKESAFLEDCVKSVLNQESKSRVLIATSTPNDYIYSVAKKYNLKVVINECTGKGIGYDFDFARNAANTELVTIAHQDDVYEPNYGKSVIENAMKYKDSLILFTDYYEIRNDEKIFKNRNLKIKRMLMSFVKFNKLASIRLVKRSCIMLGNAICCPAVTFNMYNINTERVFNSPYKANIDWYAWEILSKRKGRFVYINNKLMGHRIHVESTTTEIINDNVRTKEDYDMFLKFWPKSIAKFLNKFYVKAEESNN